MKLKASIYGGLPVNPFISLLFTFIPKYAIIQILNDAFIGDNDGNQGLYKENKLL